MHRSGRANHYTRASRSKLAFPVRINGTTPLKQFLQQHQLHRTHFVCFRQKAPRKTHPGFTLSRNAANVPPACGGGGGARFKFCTGDWWIGPGRFRGFADLSIFSEPQTLTKVTCVGKTLSFCGIQIVQEKKIYESYCGGTTPCK